MYIYIVYIVPYKYILLQRSSQKVQKQICICQRAFTSSFISDCCFEHQTTMSNATYTKQCSTIFDPCMQKFVARVISQQTRELERNVRRWFPAHDKGTFFELKPTCLSWLITLAHSFSLLAASALSLLFSPCHSSVPSTFAPFRMPISASLSRNTSFVAERVRAVLSAACTLFRNCCTSSKASSSRAQASLKKTTHTGTRFQCPLHSFRNEKNDIETRKDTVELERHASIRYTSEKRMSDACSLPVVHSK
jgi:hypothetical protein